MYLADTDLVAHVDGDIERALKNNWDDGFAFMLRAAKVLTCGRLDCSIAVGFRFKALQLGERTTTKTRYDRLSWLRGAAVKLLPNLWHLSASAGLGATRHLNSNIRNASCTYQCHISISSM